jgi:DNA-binding GntR family transcriptional regulator
LSDTWSPLYNPTLADRVYQVLRDRVLAGKIVPGDFIREQEVSSRLQVSRTPVREALGRLASEGFIERIPHRGFRVPEESAAEMFEFYPIICALEVLAAEESFPKLTSAAVAELREINAAYRAAGESRDIPAGISLNHRFHHRLSSESTNPRLTEMLDELRSQVESLEIWSFSGTDDWKDSHAEHEEILAAIEGDDLPRAIETLKQNRLATYRHYEAEQSEHWTGSRLTPTAVDHDAPEGPVGE